MKRFLTNLLIGLLLLCLLLVPIIVFDFLFVGNQYTQVYTGSILDKAARLESIQEPKILLVGNSNLSFGMDSALLEEAFDMPVVNLGLHGGLGNAFHEELAKPYIREGDIVVLCPTDFNNNEISDTILAWVTLEKHTDLWYTLRFSDLPGFLRAYPEYFLNAFKKRISHSDVPIYDDSYSRIAFNEYGDIALRPPLDDGPYLFTEGSTPVPAMDAACIARMNRYADYVHSRGASIVLSFCPIAKGEFSPPEEEYLALQEALTAQLDFPVISDIRDYFIPYEYFYDSIFHLTDDGVAIRTNQLIEDLLAWQETVPEVSK